MTQPSDASHFIIPSLAVERSGLSVPEISHAMEKQLHELRMDLQAVHARVERQCAEQERQRQSLEQLVDCLPVGIVVARAQRQVIIVNHAAEEMLGLPRTSMIGNSLDAVCSASGLPARPFSSVEYRGRVLCGREVVLKPALQPGSPDEESALILEDVTKLARLDAQVKRQVRLAAMGEMIGRIAHEIRNPLGSIELFASLLSSEVQDRDERQSLVEQILMAVRMLNHLLSNFLVVTGPPQPRRQLMDVATLIRDIVSLASHALREHAITVRERIGPDAHVLEADRTLVRQAGLNLLLNAIQASPRGGVVEITSQCIPTDHRAACLRTGYEGSTDTSMLALRVRDWGCGMSPEDQAKAFEPFFSRRAGGTGLGLAIVRQIMEVHGGWVELTSQLQEGTIVTLYFPRQEGRKA
ncbi:MAG: PAS domain-containing protein [Nitrospirae bacterium]|nr:MAG: PAS domain-containing protein [Nitrospirota bacterium]